MFSFGDILAQFLNHSFIWSSISQLIKINRKTTLLRFLVFFFLIRDQRKAAKADCQLSDVCHSVLVSSSGAGWAISKGVDRRELHTQKSCLQMQTREGELTNKWAKGECNYSSVFCPSLLYLSYCFSLHVPL